MSETKKELFMKSSSLSEYFLRSIILACAKLDYYNPPNNYGNR